ncbi:hypothetical protein HNY73_017646 [Argiope bruennichi]|uniref:Uncharacterized protein n=1 Tax=Argiope bruennichi TaxID=94029 RepID=A0A8T0EDH1_ARGBR|nr:hypothetical protein HNY73_017646 [Argiope bruennichi]
MVWDVTVHCKDPPLRAVSGFEDLLLCGRGVLLEWAMPADSYVWIVSWCLSTIQARDCPSCCSIINRAGDDLYVCSQLGGYVMVRMMTRKDGGAGLWSRSGLKEKMWGGRLEGVYREDVGGGARGSLEEGCWHGYMFGMEDSRRSKEGAGRRAEGRKKKKQLTKLLTIVILNGENAYSNSHARDVACGKGSNNASWAL